MLNDWNNDATICPKCGDDTYEVSTRTRVTAPKDGQQAAWPTRMACGCTVNRYMVWYDETGWV